jgi:hypothetical protein
VSVQSCEAYKGQVRITMSIYRYKKDAEMLFQTNSSISRDVRHLRLFALGCIDIFSTLPLGLLCLTPAIGLIINSDRSFYTAVDRSNWQPVSKSYFDLLSSDIWTILATYVHFWTPLLMGFVVFGLFGATSDARQTYWAILIRLAQSAGYRARDRKCVGMEFVENRNTTQRYLGLFALLIFSGIMQIFRLSEYTRNSAVDFATKSCEKVVEMQRYANLVLYSFVYKLTRKLAFLDRTT